MNARLLLKALFLLSLVPQAIAADLIAPPAGSGPGVVIISGASGNFPYRWYARDVAKLGYAVALVSGKEICAASSSSCSRSDEESVANLRKTITELKNKGGANSGKVAVVGFSLGGGGALVHAALLADVVAGVVAYYPSITKLPSISKAAAQVSVPTLILSGEQDKYFGCCLIESMREFEVGVRAKGLPVELVAYPNADHGFNLDGSKYRPDETADAWERTTTFLAKALPVN